MHSTSLINKEVDPVVAVGVDRNELQDKIEARGIHLLTKRLTASGALLIFVNSNEITEQIKTKKHKNIKLSKGLVRDPKDQRNYLEEDKRSFVLCGITTMIVDSECLQN